MIVAAVIISCKKGKVDNVTSNHVSTTIIELSNPYEALNMLKKEIDITIWSKQLTVYENDNDDRSELSLFMGRNITFASST